ncbi:protein kinase [Sorangium sp. So ce448]|uniref:serine/threonine-protein kinase n=1 Tax=Sorangium sp. So ce448 TaxID=3133314 RepID=UPI003F63E155
MAREALKAGDVFLDYRITEVIDAGGMGEVYKAVEDYSDDVVAIKCMLPRHLKREDFARRFRQECKFYPKLKHPNIVRMKKAGVSPDHVAYIVMDYLEGRTLRKLLNKAYRLDFLSAMHVMLQVADAMTFVHSKGIWHRDLKPENIMVGTKADAKGHVWLLDFGIAKFADGGMNTDDLPDVGTVRYISPEQVKMLYTSSRKAERVERARPDGRTDIYAFGAIFYEVLTGKHLFLDDSEPATAEETLTGHLVAAPEPVHEIVPDCPEFLWPVVARCIAIDREERYPRFDDVARDLRGLLRDTVPAGHVLAQRLARERMEAERQAAFAGVALEDSAPVEGEAETEEARQEGGMERAGAEGEKRARRVVHGETAPLEQFVAPASALPFAPASRVPRGRGVGHTEPLPALKPLESTAKLSGKWAEQMAQARAVPPPLPQGGAPGVAGAPPVPAEVRAGSYAGLPPMAEMRVEGYSGPLPVRPMEAQYGAGPQVSQPLQYAAAVQASQPLQYAAAVQASQPLQYAAAAQASQPLQYAAAAQASQPLQYAAAVQASWSEAQRAAAPSRPELEPPYVTPHSVDVPPHRAVPPPLPVTGAQRAVPPPLPGTGPQAAAPPPLPVTGPQAAAPYATPPLALMETQRAVSVQLPIAAAAPLPLPVPSSVTAPSAGAAASLRSEAPRTPVAVVAQPRRRRTSAYVLAPVAALALTLAGVGVTLWMRAARDAAPVPVSGEPAAPVESAAPTAAAAAPTAAAVAPTAAAAAPAVAAPAPEASSAAAAPAPEAAANAAAANAAAANAAAASAADVAAEGAATEKGRTAAAIEATSSGKAEAPSPASGEQPAAKAPPAAKAAAVEAADDEDFYPMPKRQKPSFLRVIEERKKAAPAKAAAPAQQGGAKPCPSAGCRPF